MQCEVCGNSIFGEPKRVIVEGVKMLTCHRCAKLGEDQWEPESKAFRNYYERKSITVKHIVRRDDPIKKSFSEDLVVSQNFGIIVRKARRQLDLSIEDLGRKISEKVSVIKKVESEKMIPDLKLAMKLENALGIELLVYQEEPEKINQDYLPKRDITFGEIALVKESRRQPKDERNHSKQKRKI